MIGDEKIDELLNAVQNNRGIIRTAILIIGLPPVKNRNELNLFYSLNRIITKNEAKQ